jgi:ABC-type uncharacterized transport system permease subunit
MTKKNEFKFSLIRGACAMGIALLVAFLLIYISAKGSDRLGASFEALRQMLISPIFRKTGGISTKSLCDILAGMIPIIFTGLATCVMFSANQFNLGAEGGIMLGAFVTGVVAVYAKLPAGILPLVAILAGSLTVAAVMLIPAVLKAKLGVSEMVNSLMLNYVIMYFIDYMMNAHLADTSRGTTQTLPYQDAAHLPQLVNNGSRLSWGFVIAIHLRHSDLVLHVPDQVGLRHPHDRSEPAVRQVFRHERRPDRHSFPGHRRPAGRHGRRHRGTGTLRCV